MEANRTTMHRGPQAALSNRERIEQVIEHFYALSLADQQALLMTACPEIVPRLDDVTREGFIAELRKVPLERQLSEPKVDERVESRDEVLEDLLNQPLPAQEHFLRLVCPRVVAAFDIDEHGRQDFLGRLDQAIAAVDAGNLSPTIH